MNYELLRVCVRQLFNDVHTGTMWHIFFLQSRIYMFIINAASQSYTCTPCIQFHTVMYFMKKKLHVHKTEIHACLKITKLWLFEKLLGSK